MWTPHGRKTRTCHQRHGRGLARPSPACSCPCGHQQRQAKQGGLVFLFVFISPTWEEPRRYTRICSAHQRPMFRVFVDERGRQVCEPGCVQGAPSSPSCTGADDTRWVPGGWLGPGGGGQQESDKRCVHLWRRLQLGHNNTHTRPVDPSALPSAPPSTLLPSITHKHA